MRILHVVASLQGGAALHVLHLSRMLRERGHSVAICAPNDNPSLAAKIHSLRIPLYDAPLDSTFPLEAVMRVKSILESEDWTHLHVHGHRAALTGRLASLLYKNPVPVIYTVHGYHPTYYSNIYSQYAVNLTERILRKCTASYICVSESTQKDMLAAVPQASGKSVVIENAIPLEPLSANERNEMRHEARSAFAIPSEAFVIGTIGRLQWQKSITRLLRAFRMVRDARGDLYLLIVGDGPMRKHLETLARSLEIEDRCFFVGHKPNPVPYYAAMDLFVLPSLWEGLPLTILEAWAAGTPVAATDVAGSRDMIRDGETGLLAKNTLNGIADVIQQARGSVDLFPEMTENARRELKTRFTLEQKTRLTEQVYRQTGG